MTDLKLRSILVRVRLSCIHAHTGHTQHTRTVMRRPNMAPHIDSHTYKLQLQTKRTATKRPAPPPPLPVLQDGERKQWRTRNTPCAAGSRNITRYVLDVLSRHDDTIDTIVQFVGEIGISYNFQLSERFHADAHNGCEIESLLWCRVMANACAFSATIYALPHCERRPGILSCRKNFAQRLQRAFM